MSTVALSHPALATWVCGLLQTSDSYFPTGSYAHSFGLEGLVHESLVTDRASLRTFLHASILPALEHTDVPLLLHSAHALAEPNWAQLRELSELASALKTSAEARAASHAIGRQRVQLAATLHPKSIAADFLARAEREAWPFSAPISAAVEGAAIGAPVSASASAYCYTGLSGVLAAAMKLLRLGQNSAQALLTEALREVPPLTARAGNVGVDDIGWFNPWLDIAAARHERADGRMFIS